MESVTDPRSIRAGGWLTDSRVYNIVWLGRWLERFDCLARMLGGIAHSSQDISGARAFERSLESAALAFGIAVPGGDSEEEQLLAAFGEVLASCLKNARDDATQAGSLELIQELNSLLDELPDVWDPREGPSGLMQSSRYLSARADQIGALCEGRWAHSPTR
jgi:uncharacterized alpha-E superfamily protein